MNIHVVSKKVKKKPPKVVIFFIRYAHHADVLLYTMNIKKLIREKSNVSLSLNANGNMSMRRVHMYIYTKNWSIHACLKSSKY